MSNNSAPPDPPPSLSAAELRRRLLASTPPPLAASAAATPFPAELNEAGNGTSPPVSTWGNSTDTLGKLKLPGQPGGSQPDIAPPDAPPGSQAAPPKRSPVIGARLQNPDNPSSSGVRGMPPSRVVSGGSGVQSYASSRPAPAAATDSSSAEVQRLRSENRELRQLLEEMKHLLQEASDTEQQYATRETELEEEVLARQRQIDELSTQLQSIEEQITNGTLAPHQPAPQPKTRTELEDWADELERDSAKISQERKKLDEERHQLREDEESLEHQMREMEVSMARERAMMARQEMELKRLSAEIQHELELMQRGDATLREHMQKFQRRAADVMQGKIGGGGNPGAPPGGRR